MKQQAHRSVQNGLTVYNELFNVDAFELIASESANRVDQEGPQGHPAARIEHKKIDIARSASVVVHSEDTEQWKIEQQQISSLIHFNLLLIAFNLVLLVYAMLDTFENKFPYLICCMPVLNFLFTMIMTNFTLRYFRLARTLKMLFSPQLNAQVKAMQSSF